MFSLIITIISIALVAALTLATLYYGSDAFNQGAASARASQKLSETQQLMGAAELFYANRGSWPASLQVMVDERYLKSVPTGNVALVGKEGAPSAFSAAYAQTTPTWEMAAPHQPVFVIPVADKAECLQLNAKGNGVEGILTEARTSLRVQCFGRTESSLVFVAARNGQHLRDVEGEHTLLPDGSVIDGNVPAPEDDGWLEPPTGNPGPVTPPPAGGALAVDVSPVDFGQVATFSSESRVVTLTNTGDMPLSFTAPAALGGSSSFVLGLSTCDSGLVPAESCTIVVEAAPSTVGPFSGTLTLTTNLTPSETLVPLSGEGINPLSLQGAALPEAKRNIAFSAFDFKSLLDVSNETSPDKGQATWSVQGTLPAGMSLDSATGVLSGTPSAATAPEGVSFSVTGSYKSNEATQSYNLLVGLEGLQAARVWVGTQHACALMGNGGLKCWGGNNAGQLGTGNTTSSATPVDVVGLGGTVTKVALNNSTTCALMSNASVKCWGVIDAWTGTWTHTPTDKAGATNVLDIQTANTGSTNSWCVLKSGGAVQCWGSSDYGMLGDGTPDGTWRASLGTVTNLGAGVTAIARGGVHSCAVIGGSVRCWGRNNLGQLGNGSSMVNSVPNPVNVSSLTGVTSIAAGGNTTCAVASGALHCWGTGGDGQFGTGTSPFQRTTPLASQLSANVSNVVVGENFTCAILIGGEVRCAGADASGQLGNGAAPASSVHGTVSGLTTGATELQAGPYHVCAKVGATEHKCWGRTFDAAFLGAGAGAQQSPVDLAY